MVVVFSFAETELALETPVPSSFSVWLKLLLLLPGIYNGATSHLPGVDDSVGMELPKIRSLALLYASSRASLVILKKTVSNHTENENKKVVVLTILLPEHSCLSSRFPPQKLALTDQH